jgi:hypothetical protein
MSTWTSWFGWNKPAEPSDVEKPAVPTQRKSYRDALLTPPAIVACPSIDDSYVLVSPISSST